MAIRSYDLYPELVRQFMVMVMFTTHTRGWREPMKGLWLSSSEASDTGSLSLHSVISTGLRTLSTDAASFPLFLSSHNSGDYCVQDTSIQAQPPRPTSVTQLCAISARYLPTHCCARWNQTRCKCRNSHCFTMRCMISLTWVICRDQQMTSGSTLALFLLSIWLSWRWSHS